MGISRTDYLVYGWKLPYQANLTESMDRERGNLDEDILGVNDEVFGKYSVFGVKLGCGESDSGWDFIQIPKVGVLATIDERVVRARHRVVGDMDFLAPSLFIFSNFS